MMRFLLLFLLLAGPALAADVPVQEDPLERQMLDIAKDLRCTVCQSERVSESNSGLARDMRALIREQLREGKSREEIMDYFVARYGNYILMKPPFDPLGAALWIGPALLLLGAAAFAVAYLRSRLKPAAAPQPPPLSPEDRDRVRDARTSE